MNYTYFFKEQYESISDLKVDEEYDLFIATYNFTDRVKRPAEHISAKKKIWLMLPDYQEDVFLANKTQYYLSGATDYDGILKFFRSLIIQDGMRLCIDATGFIIPHLLILLKCLRNHEHHPTVDILYSEADRYSDAESTVFSQAFTSVCQIRGYEGQHVSKMESDIMIIASGYDYSRIRDVASYKKRASKVQMIGFPSMKADMFQENILAASEADLFSVCPLANNIFTPAYDPFVAAQTIKEYIEEREQKKHITNIYLAPLSSKPLAIGMALYYLWENGEKKPMSIVYPECDKYIQDNAVGIGRIWLYQDVL